MSLTALGTVVPFQSLVHIAGPTCIYLQKQRELFPCGGARAPQLWGRRRRAGAGNAQRARAAPSLSSPAPQAGPPGPCRGHRAGTSDSSGRKGDAEQEGDRHLCHHSFPRQLRAGPAASVGHPAAAPAEPSTSRTQPPPELHRGPSPRPPAPGPCSARSPTDPRAGPHASPGPTSHQPLGERREATVRNKVRGFSLGSFLNQQAIPVPVTINH